MKMTGIRVTGSKKRQLIANPTRIFSNEVGTLFFVAANNSRVLAVVTVMVTIVSIGIFHLLKAVSMLFSHLLSLSLVVSYSFVCLSLSFVVAVAGRCRFCCLCCCRCCCFSGSL